MPCCNFFSKNPNNVYRVIRPNNIFSVDPLILSESLVFCDNRIISSHYTWWNFIPLNIYEQLHHISNLAFVIIAFIYLFASGSTRFLSVFIPLSFNMSVAMLKDGIYDYARHKQDRAVNDKTFEFLEFDSEHACIKWKRKKSQDIHVGDVILCRNEEEFPCDMIILASSDTRCKFEITTANLDGETTLKTHFSHKSTQEVYFKLSLIKEIVAINSIDWFPQSIICAECEPPNADLNHFEGKLICKELKNYKQIEVSKVISFENVVLRGSKLKNTDFVIGLPIYTGKDTKLSLNSKATSRKYTSREAMLNVILALFILISISLSIILSIGATLWAAAYSDVTWYIGRPKFSPWEFVQNVFLFCFTTNSILPISLIVTLELQQIILSFFITNDLEMYDYQQKMRTSTKTVHTVDELGQVEFLFSDKTGTLTQNLMELNAFSIFPSNQTYLIRQGNWRAVKQLERKSTDRLRILAQPVEDHNKNDKKSTMVKSPEYIPKEMEKLFTVAVLCHTIDVKEYNKINYDEGFNIPKETKPVYQATSPDEKALVEAAASIGITLVSMQMDEHNEGSRQAKVSFRTASSHSAEECQTVVYSIDAVLEFDSVRKRMTVMARHPDGSCYIHSKGAETSMLSSESCSGSPGHIQGQALQRVNEFAMHGLRTLVLASRKLQRDEYQTLLNEWNAALQLFGQDRAKAIRVAQRKIESGLEIVGVTGVEDKLQPKVPECLKSLREAGIKIWVLTGDKEQTAITVSQAAGHFPAAMSLVRITNCPDITSVARRIFEILEGLEARTEQCNRFNGYDDVEYSFCPTIAEVDEILATAAEAELNHQAQPNTLSPSQRDGEDLADLVGRINDLRVKLISFTGTKNRSSWKRHRRTGRQARESIGAAGEPIGLVIDGQSLTNALGPALRPAFLDLCLNVNSVLCCRMTPLQKASVVQMVRLGLQDSEGCGGRPPVTAAVGDGGNDVAMILQANVGIGIYGREGREAARAADYAIPQFCYLKRLLLVHGHWAHHRITRTMLLFYNKCVSFLTLQLWLFVYTGFSAVNWFDTLYFVLYNLTMTSLAYMTYGFFEKHLTANQLLANPHLYAKITGHRSLRTWHVMLYLLDGVWQGTVIFFFAYLFLCGGEWYAPAMFIQSADRKAHLFDFNMIGAATFMIIVICANLRLTIYVRDFNVLYLVALLVTILSNCVLFALIQAIAGPTSYHSGLYTMLLSSSQFWLSVPITVFTANVPALIWRTISDTWWINQLGTRIKFTDDDDLYGEGQEAIGDHFLFDKFTPN